MNLKLDQTHLPVGYLPNIHRLFRIINAQSDLVHGLQSQSDVVENEVCVRIFSCCNEEYLVYFLKVVYRWVPLLFSFLLADKCGFFTPVIAFVL